LERFDLVGESCARYYQIGTGRYKQLANSQHSSLCSTAMKGPALELFRRVCQRADKFLDLSLWQRFAGTRSLRSTQMVVGIKGLPGRPGIGAGHKPEFSGQVDEDGSILRQWTGANHDLYERFHERHSPAIA
jgi:hypothetical protein